MSYIFSQRGTSVSTLSLKNSFTFSRIQDAAAASTSSSELEHITSESEKTLEHITRDCIEELRNRRPATNTIHEAKLDVSWMKKVQQL